MSPQAPSSVESSSSPNGAGATGPPTTAGAAPLLNLLNERLRFESMLSRLSTTFINLPPEKVDGQIERGLQQVVEFLGIERSSLGQFSEDGRAFVVTHSSSISGIGASP